MTTKGKAIKTAEEKAMANARRLESMRRNLDALESKANAIMNKGAESVSYEEARTLLSLLKIAYHDSGKIEEIASIDGTSACEFCAKMRAAADDNNLIICGGCYAYADKWKEAAWRRHQLNARILSFVVYPKELLEKLAIPSILCRINEDGDVSNVTHARNILRIMEAFKFFTSFGFWYKNVSAVAEALKAEGVTNNAEKRRKYRRTRFVQSSVLIGFPAVPAWFSDVVFTVYPDKETTEKAIVEGAWECNGRKCKDCGFNCYDSERNTYDGNVQHVAEVLRCNANKRAEIMDAYRAKLESMNK